MNDTRGDVFDKIMMTLISKGMNVEGIKDDIFIILDQYEMQERETALSLLQEDRNEYLFKKFIVAKTVKGLTEKSLKAYMKEIPKIIEKIGKTIDDIETDDIRLYLAKRSRTDKVTKTTIGNEIRYLRSFINWCFNEGLIKNNPMNKIDSIPIKRSGKKAFTEEEVELLRLKAQTAKDKCIIEVLLSTGCRISELCGMKVSEVDLKEGKVIVHGKGEKDRTVYFTERAKLYIRNYLDERKDDNEYLFPRRIPVVKGNKKGITHAQMKLWYKYPELIEPDKAADKCSIEAIIRKLGKQNGIKAYPHKFRRTCATMALKRGMPIEQVSKMLGHESIETTQIYLDLNEEMLEYAHKKYVY